MIVNEQKRLIYLTQLKTYMYFASIVQKILVGTHILIEVIWFNGSFIYI